MMFPTVRPLHLCLCLMFLWSVFCLDPVHQPRHIRSDDMGSIEAVVATQAQKVSALEADLQAAKNTITSNQNTINGLQSDLNNVQLSQGSTFIRWGRSTCPSSSTMLYSGIAGGSYYGHTGGGANRLCLTKEPVFDDTHAESAHGELDGAEYYIPGHHYTDVVCAVCRTSFSDTYMMPGTNRCPTGSALQYHGHLTSNNIDLAANSEFVCLDASPEDRLGSGGSQASAYFEYVTAHCGSLPCPPYVDNKVVTCAVCSV